MVETTYPTRRIPWYAVFVLAFMYWVSILDRFIITLLVEPIKRDLHISDVQFGMLHGLAFSVTFSVFGLILGSLADRVSRRWLIFACISTWSLATALCGFAQQFWQMLLARVGVGVGEAALNPSASSMIADLFPRPQIRWYAGCLVVATPLGVLATTSDTAWVFLVGIGVFLTLISSFNACAVTALNLVTPSELRGTGVAFYAASSGLFGAALGPMLIALLSQTYFSGPSSIGFGIATLMAICCPTAGTILVLGFRAMREAVEQAEWGQDES